jgi:hypothetical protein
MRVLVAIFALLGFSNLSYGDIRYRVRPRLGELASFGRTPQKFDCDQSTRSKLWMALSKQPVITVQPNGVIDVSFNFESGKKLKAARQYRGAGGKIIGFWDSEISGLTFEVAIQEKQTKPPIVEVAINIDMPLPDGSRVLCSEKWIGIGDKF